MSTKNLARTLIEGGRYAYNRWDRRYSNAQHRAGERQVAPAERWLRSQVGRPWNRVRSDLVERFDSRTTAGRHILYDHLLPSVEGLFGHRDFVVDPHGILRRVPRPRVRRTSHAFGLPQVPAVVVAWLVGRLVGQRGETLFWFTPAGPGLLRQHRRLEARELKFWLGLPLWLRKQFDAFVAVTRERE